MVDMKKIFLLALLFLISAPAIAEDGYICSVEKERITKDLMKDVTCTHDEECGWFDYGYPWQPAPCVKAIVNTSNENHNLANLRLIEEYNNYCIYPNADEKKQYDEFESTKQSAECNIQRAYCYKGFCRSKNYAIYNDK